MSKIVKEPKPTKNLLAETLSHQKKFKTYIRELPEAKHYRKQLEPLLGEVVMIQCDAWEIHPSTVDGKECDKLLLTHASVVKAPKSRDIECPVPIHHIWTVVDSGWKVRNPLSPDASILCKGFMYLYNKDGTKNIGLQLLSAKPQNNKQP